LRRILFQISNLKFQICSNDLNTPPYATLAVDHLAAFFRAHATPESDGAGAFHFAYLVRVMHE
jgi:hypothetical protein